MPNIHETIKQREIEAGGPGSGRKPGGGWGDFGQGKTSNKRLGIKYDRMSDISHLTPHGHGFKPGNMYPHECAVCGYQKAQHKNGGPVKVKGLSAGGPGSGRKPGSGLGKLSDKADNLFLKHSGKHQDKYMRAEDTSNKDKANQLRKEAGAHERASSHFQTASDHYYDGNKVAGDKSMSRGFAHLDKFGLKH